MGHYDMVSLCFCCRNSEKVSLQEEQMEPCKLLTYGTVDDRNTIELVQVRFAASEQK